MASRKEFKKDLNDVLSGIIEDCYLIQLSSDDKQAAKAEKIIDEAIESFDKIIHKVYQDGVTDYKSHYKELKTELTKNAAALTKKVDKLSE